MPKKIGRHPGGASSHQAQTLAKKGNILMNETRF